MPFLVADNHESIQDPNVNLWLMAIVRAIHDLLGVNMSCSGSDYYRRKIRASAEYFLFRDDESLGAVCDAIGIDMSWVRKIASERMARKGKFKTRAASVIGKQKYVGKVYGKAQDQRREGYRLKKK